MHDQEVKKEREGQRLMSPDSVPDLVFRSADISEIDLVRPLWEQLNNHHRTNARAFRDLYRQWSFEDRKVYFSQVAAAGALRIELAYDSLSCRYIGYCVSSLSPEKNGEIESIFVEHPFRQRGIGTTLLKQALAWLDANASIRNRVSVADGNEDAFPFYREFGFFPRMTVLEQKNAYPRK
ncbi:MAG TPA: GNAT family N-acetyltransferase [Methanoregulaceae archaeon]|nr:GNAT family N-acetyltransferase [Methanoregulaceae archaeon]HRY74964.1 GNAT family N-acetyltransferase [Methanoregulaceae archaeon]